MGFFSRLRSDKTALQPPPPPDSKGKGHTRSSFRSNSFTGSEFSSTASDSSHTSSESMGFNSSNQQQHHQSKSSKFSSKPKTETSSTAFPSTPNKKKFLQRPQSEIVTSKQQYSPIPVGKLRSSKELPTPSKHRSPSRKPPTDDFIDSPTPQQNSDPMININKLRTSPLLPMSPSQQQHDAQQEFIEPLPSRIPRKKSPLSQVHTEQMDFSQDFQYKTLRPSTPKQSSLSPKTPKNPIVEIPQPPFANPHPINGSENSSPTSQFNFNPASSSAYSQSQQFSSQKPAARQGSNPSEGGDSSEEDLRSSVSTLPPTQHPYYEQWKQYYETLAAQFAQQQQQANGDNSQAPPVNPMMFMQMPFVYNPFAPPHGSPGNGMATMNYSTSQLPDPALMYQQQQLFHSQSQLSGSSYPSSAIQSPIEGVRPQFEFPEQPQHDYLTSYKKSKNMQTEIINEDNELVSNSRKSTVKSNRYPSAPSSFIRKDVTNIGNHMRVSSVESNFKPNEFQIYDEEDGDSDKSRSVSYSSTGFSSPSDSTGSIAKLSQMSLTDRKRELSRHISDYNKFLFGNGDEDSESEEELGNHNKTKDSQNDEDKTLIADKAPPVDHQLPTPTSEDGLSAKDSSNSVSETSSVNSIQSDGPDKFIVGELKPKVKSPNRRQSNVSPATVRDVKKEAKPVVKGNSVYSSYPYNTSVTSLTMGMPPPPQSRSMEPVYMAASYSNPMLSVPTEYNGSTTSFGHNRRQSIATAEAKRRSMIGLNGYLDAPVINKRNSMPMFGAYQQQPQAPRITEPIIAKKIQDFIKLRNVIASGNKTIEYRLYWVKMLVTAINYKLYAYINIKGDPIQPEQGPSNKLLFIKSMETQLTKLLKEFESGRIEREGVESELYFVYASLLKQDFVASHNQDFGFEKDAVRAIEYYEKVLEVNPKDFKALYKIGEIHEYDFEGQFERAVEFYTEAAKFGYNRAIFKISMLYLHVPELRSVKFLKYLHGLSNIELKDVRLDEEDFEEMQEIVGLASYELGRIYEGLYPGDLSMEDDFILRSVEIAPVNYAKSLTYYNKAAKLDCLLAQVRLGIVYEKGELNRQQNPNKSIQWFIKASSSPLSFKRHPEAMIGLARWYLRGSDGSNKHIPVPAPEKAVIWCDRAIKEFNSADAMFMMGELSEMGFTGSNPQTWYKKSYDMGFEPAAEKLGLVE
ncbi:uncharacterized protein J8A68_002477 [[Candida] subhashii]|uniref:Activator of C kinase protein 1 n=1 Tax=[Candida] subhashii TaxID=561895 RepID=A0A8J5UP15_9ASCO|nr:uncharacterized protein J8A68_002477 [[Candida] subhashii]KAG7663976.1 hypothetical protein J8A68_002477 [[Candida] subhashii]